MVKYYHHSLDHIFFALSDATRRGILSELQKGYKNATQLAAPFAVSLPMISKHLKILEKANLLERFKKGRIHYFSLKKEGMQEAQEWIAFFDHFWTQKLDNLEAFLALHEKGKSDE